MRLCDGLGKELGMGIASLVWSCVPQNSLFVDLQQSRTAHSVREWDSLCLIKNQAITTITITALMIIR